MVFIIIIAISRLNTEVYTSAVPAYTSAVPANTSAAQAYKSAVRAYTSTVPAYTNVVQAKIQTHDKNSFDSLLFKISIRQLFIYRLQLWIYHRFCYPLPH